MYTQTFFRVDQLSPHLLALQNLAWRHTADQGKVDSPRVFSKP